MQKVTDNTDDDKQDSTKDCYISCGIGKAIGTGRISCMKTEDAAQGDGNDGQEREEHVVGGLDHPLIALSIAYIDQERQGDKDGSEKNRNNSRDIHNAIILHLNYVTFLKPEAC